MGLPIGLPERSRRAFWARLYARRRLLSDLAAPFAPMHYALIGERLGYRPNAFFDPDTISAPMRTSRRTRAEACSRPILPAPNPMRPSPSAEFDHGWYVSQNPDWAQSHPHPFLHFLERGLRAGRRPRADIDVEFVRDITRGVKPRSLEEAAFRVFDRTLSEGEMGPPLNRQELRARQDRFYADGRLRIEREAAHPERNVLVFVQCGQGFDAAYLEEPRSYDVLLNYYHEASRPSESRHRRSSGRNQNDLHSTPHGAPAGSAPALPGGPVSRRRRRNRRSRHRHSFSRDGGRKTRSCAAGAHRGFGHRLSVFEKTIRRPRRDAAVFGRDHGAGADASRRSNARNGHSRNRSAAGAATCFSGRRCARPSDRTASGSSARSPSGTRRRRSQRRRLLRLSASLRRRSRARGQ